MAPRTRRPRFDPKLFEILPSDGEQAKQWKLFMSMLSELSGKMDAIIELGTLLACALEEAAAAGVPPPNMFQALAGAVREFREEFRERFGGSDPASGAG